MADHHHRHRIVVDLIPLLPGGTNGGAKPYALGLIGQLAQAAPETEFVLLTASHSHTELANLDSANVRRLCVVNNDAPTAQPAPGQLVRSRAWIRSQLTRTLPARAVHWAEAIYHTLSRRPRQSQLLVELGADLLFCPFTAPFFHHPRVPLVAFVYDLQHVQYPQFFSAEQQHYRTRDFNNACRVADMVLCMSEFVRGSMLETGRVSPERVLTLRCRPAQRLRSPTPEAKTHILEQLGVQVDGFLLYPANSWPNKNHAMLLTAFGLYRARHPDSPLRLVCTGVLGAHGAQLRQAAERMGLAAVVRFPGYVDEQELAALFDTCRAVIFPSLYEGFGLPLVEAMQFGKPLLCSNVASIPEVAGDAALYFDPRRPREIAEAIELVASSSPRLTELSQAGRRRLAELPDASQATQECLRLFEALIANRAA